MTKKKQPSPQEQQLQQVIDVIAQVSRNKGWKNRITNMDQEFFRSASVHVEKSFPKEQYYELVTGTLEIDIKKNEQIRFSLAKTSFYGYGLENLLAALKTELHEIPWVKENSPQKKTEDQNTSFHIIEQILHRFDKAARQFKRRYNGRPTIEVTDEYDVQDGLHAILKCYFDDVRPEEYSPSYAGSASRVDFLLKKEQIIIEVKLASSKLTDKKIGEQLIIDIQRYQTHPDCKSLFCFVYDPDGHIVNPVALENDLSGLHGKNGLKVKVIITPK